MNFIIGYIMGAVVTIGVFVGFVFGYKFGAAVKSPNRAVKTDETDATKEHEQQEMEKAFKNMMGLDRKTMLASIKNGKKG